MILNKHWIDKEQTYDTLPIKVDDINVGHVKCFGIVISKTHHARLPHYERMNKVGKADIYQQQ